jgi:hypothetical protein
MAKENDDTTKTLGQAIDAVINALKPLDENSRITAVRATCEHLIIPLIEGIKSKTPSEPVKPSTISTLPAITDIRKLKEQKNPSSANEMAAVAAFYLSQLAPVQDRKAEVEKEDMIKCFNQALFRLPKEPRVLLQNVKNAGYFDLVGDGKYRLNPVGYNLVAYNLPRSQSKIKPKPVRAKKQRKKTKKINRMKK